MREKADKGTILAGMFCGRKRPRRIPAVFFLILLDEWHGKKYNVSG